MGETWTISFHLLQEVIQDRSTIGTAIKYIYGLGWAWAPRNSIYIIMHMCNKLYIELHGDVVTYISLNNGWVEPTRSIIFVARAPGPRWRGQWHPTITKTNRQRDQLYSCNTETRLPYQRRNNFHPYTFVLLCYCIAKCKPDVMMTRYKLTMRSPARLPERAILLLYIVRLLLWTATWYLVQSSY